MKKLIIGLIFIVFRLALANPAMAQLEQTRKKTDSLTHLLKNEKRPDHRIALLQELIYLTPDNTDVISQLLAENAKSKLINTLPYELLLSGLHFWDHKNYNQALQILQQSVSEFDKQHRAIPFLLYDLRHLFYDLDDNNARFKYFQEKLLYYQVNGPIENTAPCYTNIGGYYLEKGAYNQAISYYLKGAAVFKTFFLDIYTNDLLVVSDAYASWGNEERATFFAKKAFAAGLSAKPDMLEHYYFVMAIIAGEKRDYQDAVTEIDQSLKYISPRASQVMATSLAMKANYLLGLKKPEEALKILTHVKAMADSDDFKLVSTMGYMEIGFCMYKYYDAKQNYKLAETALLQAEKDATKSEAVPLRLKYLKELAAFYTRQNNLSLSNTYFQKYFDLQQEYDESLNEFKVAQYEIDQNDKAQQAHINQLKQEKALQNYELNRRSNLLWISGIVLLLISTLSAFIYRQLNVNKKTLISLRQTQNQLIQSEKMASLGELTAGIAHEIQNPLNFVNNFSEVNREMIDELVEELAAGNVEEVLAIATDLKQNEEKITMHGKRADGIVKGMLQHSRASSGTKEPTDLNALADEYLRLAYHGLRAKDKSFNAELITNFDDKLPKVNAVPQDIGRVMLNLYNNAFYAVQQQMKVAGPDYKPTVDVSTMIENHQVVIKIKDNGIGIPDDIKDKILQPFFTTKPTGEGTGLGLSLSYDIIVKGHGGKIDIQSKDGAGSEFIVTLPA